jgi:hypothetical protein
MSLEELPKDKTIYVYCQVGLRGYVTYRILKQNGFQGIFNLSGVYKLWHVCTVELEIASREVKCWYNYTRILSKLMIST